MKLNSTLTKKQIIYSALGFFGLLTLWLFINSSTFITTSTEKTSLIVANNQLKLALRLADDLDYYTQLLENNKTTYRVMAESLYPMTPVDKRPMVLLKDIGGMLGENGIAETSKNSYNADEENGYQTAVVDLTFPCSSQSLTSLLYDLASAKRYYRISKLSIEVDKQESRLNVQLMIIGYFQGNKS